MYSYKSRSTCMRCNNNQFFGTVRIKKASICMLKMWSTKRKRKKKSIKTDRNEADESGFFFCLGFDVWFNRATFFKNPDALNRLRLSKGNQMIIYSLIASELMSKMMTIERFKPTHVIMECLLHILHHFFVVLEWLE